MQRLTPFIIAPLLVLATSGVAYIYFMYLESGSTSGAANTPAASSSATVHATPTVSATITASPIVSAKPTPIPPLRLSRPQFSLFTINPKFTKQQVSFTLSDPAVVQVEIVPQGKTTPVRTINLGRQSAGVVHLQWDGHDDAGHLVPAGTYSYSITATDEIEARQTKQTSQELGITYKHIIVSLSQQRLTAYDGEKQVLTTKVTTGNPALPTPVGVYPILSKESPFTFKSSRSVGDKYYYPPSKVSYALLFDNQGYYIHDAPWRHVFGPGTNTKVGKPGQNYTGSHGCVNVPLDAEKKLYEWATIGTVVQVTR